MVDCLIWCIEVGVKDNILKVLPWFTALEYQHNVIGLTILAILQIKKKYKKNWFKVVTKSYSRKKLTCRQSSCNILLWGIFWHIQICLEMYIHPWQQRRKTGSQSCPNCNILLNHGILYYLIMLAEIKLIWN